MSADWSVVCALDFPDGSYRVPPFPAPLRNGPKPLAALATLAISWLLAAAPASAEEVALTFDDLPALTFSPSVDYARTTTDRLLAGLRRLHLPATGFVNESKLEGADRQARIALLDAWLDAGMDLGNHTYSHLSLTKTPVDAYIADVVRGETVTRWLLAARGRTPHRIVEWRQDLEQTGQGETVEALAIGLFRRDRGLQLLRRHPCPVEGEQGVADILAAFAQMLHSQEETAKA